MYFFAVHFGLRVLSFIYECPIHLRQFCLFCPALHYFCHYSIRCLFSDYVRYLFVLLLLGAKMIIRALRFPFLALPAVFYAGMYRTWLIVFFQSIRLLPLTIGCLFMLLRTWGSLVSHTWLSGCYVANIILIMSRATRAFPAPFRSVFLLRILAFACSRLSFFLRSFRHSDY